MNVPNRSIMRARRVASFLCEPFVRARRARKQRLPLACRGWCEDDADAYGVLTLDAASIEGTLRARHRSERASRSEKLEWARERLVRASEDDVLPRGLGISYWLGTFEMDAPRRRGFWRIGNKTADAEVDLSDEEWSDADFAAKAEEIVNLLGRKGGRRTGFRPWPPVGARAIPVRSTESPFSP